MSRDNQDGQKNLALRVLLGAILGCLISFIVVFAFLVDKGLKDCSKGSFTNESKIVGFLGIRPHWKEPITFEGQIHYGDKIHYLNCSTGEWTVTESQNDDVIARARDKGFDDCSKGNNTIESRFYGWYFGGTVTWEKTVLFGKEVYTLDCYTATVSKQTIWDEGQITGALCLGFVAIVAIAFLVQYLQQPITLSLSDGTVRTARRKNIREVRDKYIIEDEEGTEEINKNQVVSRKIWRSK